MTVLRTTPPNPSLPNGTSYPVGLNPGPILVADFNGDGIPDLAVLNRSGKLGSGGTVVLPEAPTVTILLGSRAAIASVAGLPLPLDQIQTVAASYSGDAFTQGSSTMTSPQPPQTTTALTSSDLLIPFGGSVTLTASVSANAPISGQVTFYDGATMLGSVPFNGSAPATFTATGLGLGAHALSAMFFSENALPSSAAVNVNVYGSTNPDAFNATPNPILIGSDDYWGTAATTLSWYVPSVETVEIHLGSPDGPLFAEGGFSGFAITGDWVTDGMTFYLQDTTGGKPATPANTIAALTMRVTEQSLLAASANPIIVQPGQSLGQTTIEWNAPAPVTNTEIHLGSPTGPLFTGGSASGAAQTGDWVTTGMTFFLQDTSNGKPLTDANTLSSLAVALASVPPSEFSASQNPITPSSIMNGQMAGTTTLTWNTAAASAVQVHLGSPTGPLIASGGSTGSVPTGLVADGTTFYLQEVTAKMESSCPWPPPIPLGSW